MPLIRHTEVARDDAASVTAVHSNEDTGIRYYSSAGDRLMLIFT